MDMGVDLGPSEGPGHLGNSVMQLLGPGYLDALGLLSGHGGGGGGGGGPTPGFTPPLPDLADHAHLHHPDLLQAYLSSTAPSVAGAGHMPGLGELHHHAGHQNQHQHQHQHHPGQQQGLEGLLGLGGLNPLAGTSVDNPLASYVIGKSGPGGELAAWGLGGGQGGAPGGADPCTATSEQTEGGDFDPRAHAGARHVLEGMVEIGHGGNASARARDANDYASPAPAASHGYESLGLVGAHFPGTPPRVAGLAAPKPSPSSVVAAARRPARGAGAAGAGIGPDGPPLGPGARKAGAAGDKAARSSQFRGVTKHRRSGRFEAHIWVKDLGRQVYLGGYECEEHAAEAYDIAALKCKGRRGCKTNFDLTKYADLLGCINRMTMEELVMAVRRQSQGFSRGTSSFRGVTHHPSGRWEARIGVPGSKHIYLGLFIEEREAAKAYDRALVRLRGRGAATNFALGDYKVEMADYHKMQARILGADAHFAEISSNPGLFERWVKGGCEAFPELGSNPSSHTHVQNIEGSSENIGGGMLLPAPAGSESKTPMPCPSYSHATASSGQH